MKLRVTKLVRLAVGAAAGAVGTGAAREFGRHLDAQQWERQSFSGKPVSLLGGLEIAGGMLATSLAAGSPRSAAASLVSAVGGAGAGWIDDHLEAKFPARGKGFKGHLGALREGQLTSGMAKIVIVGTGALVSSVLLASDTAPCAHSAERRSWTSLLRSSVDVAIDTVLIAGAANLVNLLDLRPGRALKFVSAVHCVQLLGVAPSSPMNNLAGGSLASAAMALPSDLSGDTMLGDLGANSLGAVLGVSLAQRGLAVRICVTGAIGMLTYASERVSFSQVIERTPWLNAIDKWGRV